MEFYSIVNYHHDHQNNYPATASAIRINVMPSHTISSSDFALTFQPKC